MDNAGTAIQPETKLEVAILSNLPDTLERSRISLANAKAAIQPLLDTIEAEGMSDELDKKCNDFLVKLRKTGEKIESDRSPFTKLFDKIRSDFTAIEKNFKAKEVGTIAYKLQAHRDAWARHKAEEQRKANEEAQRKLNVSKEQIEISASIEKQLLDYFSQYQANEMASLTKLFNTLTLENFDALSAKIKTYPFIYPFTHLKAFKPVVRPIYCTDADVNGIFDQVMKGKHEHFKAVFKETITSQVNHLVDRLPSKKQELEEIAQANAADKKRLEQEAAERQKADEERLLS